MTIYIYQSYLFSAFLVFYGWNFRAQSSVFCKEKNSEYKPYISWENH